MGVAATCLAESVAGACAGAVTMHGWVEGHGLEAASKRQQSTTLPQSHSTS